MRRLLFIIVTLLLVGCEVDPSVQQSVERAVSSPTKTIIRDVEKVEVRYGDGYLLVFYKFEYEGHEYLTGRGETNIPIHSPACKCHQKEEKPAESLFDFDW